MTEKEKRLNIKDEWQEQYNHVDIKTYSVLCVEKLTLHHRAKVAVFKLSTSIVNICKYEVILV